MKQLTQQIYSSRNGKTVVQLACKSDNSIRIESSLEIPGEIHCSTPEIGAAKSESGSRDEFVLLANSGVPMMLGNFYYPVIINMEGVKFSRKTTPVIADHDTSLRVGHTLKQAVIPAGKSKKFDGVEYDGPLIFARGVRSSDMQVASGIIADAKNGFPFQVSVGADILKATYLEDDEKATVNGKTVKGPMIIAEESMLREYTITVLGADSNTSTLVQGADDDTVSNRIAAHHHFMSESEEDSMKFEAWVESLGLTIAALDANQLAKLRASFDQQVTAGIIQAENTVTKDALAATAVVPTTQTSVAAGAPVNGNLNTATLIMASQGARGNDGNAGGFDLAQVTGNITQVMANAQLRIDGINQIMASYPTVEKVNYLGQEMTIHAFKSKVLGDPNVSRDQVELTMLRAGYALPGVGNGPAIHMGTALRDVGPQAVSCAILRQMGIAASKRHKVTGEQFGYEHFFKQEVLEASDHRDLRAISIHQLMDMTIAAAGMSFSGQRKSDGFVSKCQEALQKLRASGQMTIEANASGPTTLAISTIFEDVMHKAMLAAYMMVDTTWQEFARVMNVQDFRTHNLYRLEMNGAYRKVGVDGQLEHGTFSEAKFTHQADTYGKIVGLNRKHLINDDMNAFQQIANGLGLEAGVSLEELVYVTLLSALATFFPTDGSKNNYVSGASSVLSVDGYDLATQKFKNQINDENSPIGVPADRVLIGTAQSVLAGQLYRDSQYAVGGTTGKSFVSNPWVGGLRPIESPFMNNVLIKQRVSKANYGAAIPGQSATQYIIFGNPNAPQGGAIMVSLLNGNRLPVVQQDDAPFDQLGLRWRAYHDFGVDMGDPKLAVYVKGAA